MQGEKRDVHAIMRFCIGMEHRAWGMEKKARRARREVGRDEREQEAALRQAQDRQAQDRLAADSGQWSAPQNSRNNLPAPTKAPSNPFSRRAYQKITALIPKIGIPITGSNFSLTSIKLMFVPH